MILCNKLKKRKEKHMEYNEIQVQQRRRAVAKYTEKVDRVNCLLPPGTKERIRNVSDDSLNSFIKKAVLAQLDILEKSKR